MGVSGKARHIPWTAPDPLPNGRSPLPPRSPPLPPLPEVRAQRAPLALRCERSEPSPAP
ncbi:hypothetical protein GCM10009846_25550 [Agrococcus versicolor]|uniref:Uncharacterized protein n=1 Tax=Agrococcus versicolor TaxID=501482 RepID=A0ABN3AX12_9MICO